FAVMLAAGLKGMEQNYVLPEPVEADIFHMDQAALDAHGITALPGSLYEAAEEMRASELVRETLGEHIFTKLYENKIMEWDRYRTQVTQYEIERYLPVL
ncbi:MAG: glutamine synthetase, partial [Desulfovibrio sp.]|nr:glutamine synthetase [Desulfovibrio sp.]